MPREQNGIDCSSWKWPTRITVCDCLANSRLIRVQNVVKGIVQMPFKHWQAWESEHPSREPVSMCDHPPGKEMLCNIQSKPPLHISASFPDRSCHWRCSSASFSPKTTPKPSAAAHRTCVPALPPALSWRTKSLSWVPRMGKQKPLNGSTAQSLLCTWSPGYRKYHLAVPF